MNSEEFWGMHVQNLGGTTTNPQHTYKWPPYPQSPEVTTSAALQEYDDREKFRRKFAIAALKAGVPVPGHLSPEGRYEDVMMMPDTGCISGHFDNGAMIDTESISMAGGYFSNPYFSQTAEIHSLPSMPAARQRWRCSVEGCTKKFKSKQALKYHNEVCAKVSFYGSFERWRVGINSLLFHRLGTVKTTGNVLAAGRFARAIKITGSMLQSVYLEIKRLQPPTTIFPAPKYMLCHKIEDSMEYQD
ncbi:hypothetical protein P167DRAFT_142146 [Morchella conica CCBAS932]|uniref:Uncharacterized protein n=1 Tax=Morchella conica CCBAS932 TaxID=1392247 RepID=A0A3N4KUF5_9PEZI|nr:hypothetical protein P167DRAFT_142146 [Morchella conica CCBAS932]